MNILGISCYYHDSAAVLVRDGEVIMACQEERFSRNKHDADFPIYAINACFQNSDLTINDIDYIVFHEKPFLKFSRVIIDHIKSYPFSYPIFRKKIPYWFKERLILPLIIEKELGYKGKVLFSKHHVSHAASAFLASPYNEASILTVDGVGELATATYGIGINNNINLIKELLYPNSLGLIYSTFTSYLGFKNLNGEGKVMGLAAYGQPAYEDEFQKIVLINDDGSFSINKNLLSFNKGSVMYSKKFIDIFGRPRKIGDNLEQRHYDIAATLQYFTEKILIRILNHVYKKTKMNKLCLAGGVFLNCVANHKILEGTQFNEIFIQPASNDSGCALGAALYLYNTVLNNKRKFIMNHVYLGPEFSKDKIIYAIKKHDLCFEDLDEITLCKKIARFISKNKIVGWFQGRMEWGPRALGNRSILANPCNPNIKNILNTKVKKREGFRPYAPAVLEERVLDFFKLKQKSPFMLFAVPVVDSKKKLIPGVVHVDGTSRVATVNRNDNSKFWQLIKEFENITGVPMLLNTSLNLHGEPIACSPDDAILCFKESEMDYLVLDNYLISRKNVNNA